ncbi:hypothetical protein ACN28I_23165 [Archangium gephyra]|uniref:hypothetical protein n=1 Tax=Archangium gephyra TaxID=48 RepID=UPI003B829507
MSDVFDQAIDRVLSRKNREVYELLQRSGLYDNVATAIRGRKVLVRGRWLTDFASCNYLGLDLRPEVMEAIGPAVREWGTHPSWARMCCSPELYERLEAGLAALLGTEDALVLPTISLIGIGLIPALTGKGAAIFADKEVHKVNHDGCRLARDMGATLTSFHHGDLSTLEAGLATHADATARLVVVDGVLSTTGRLPELGRIVVPHRQRLCGERGERGARRAAPLRGGHQRDAAGPSAGAARQGGAARHAHRGQHLGRGGAAHHRRGPRPPDPEGAVTAQ